VDARSTGGRQFLPTSMPMAAHHATVLQVATRPVLRDDLAARLGAPELAASSHSLTRAWRW
jgi:hypothetical protein